MEHPDIPADIAQSETLGRGIFSSSNARKAKGGTVPRRIFLERWGERTISVDRLDFVEPEGAAALGDSVAAQRNATFHGWAVIAAQDAEGSGRRVVVSPLHLNPYHADITLPDSAVEEQDEQLRHAQELADASSWRSRPGRSATPL